MTPVFKVFPGLKDPSVLKDLVVAKENVVKQVPLDPQVLKEPPAKTESLDPQVPEDPMAKTVCPAVLAPWAQWDLKVSKASPVRLVPVVFPDPKGKMDPEVNPPFLSLCPQTSTPVSSTPDQKSFPMPPGIPKCRKNVIRTHNLKNGTLIPNGMPTQLILMWKR